jgi:2-oxoglutarate dehydrogenase E1 component
MARGSGLSTGEREAAAFELASRDSARMTVRTRGRAFSATHAGLSRRADGACMRSRSWARADRLQFEIINSPLTEAGVVGFEYGYSLEWPNGLVAWEASSATS